MEISDLTPEQLEKIAAGLGIGPGIMGNFTTDQLAELIRGCVSLSDGEGAELSDAQLDSVWGGRFAISEKLRSLGTEGALASLANIFGMAGLDADQIQSVIVGAVSNGGGFDLGEIDLRGIIRMNVL